MSDEKVKTASLESSKPKKDKEFRSPEAMIRWQWRSILEELGELQRHLSDPSCPCTLADAGEYCAQKHTLGLHTLAKETIPMVPEYYDMLEQLAEEALTQHNALNSRITCNVHDPAEKDTVLWSRQWRKKIEQIYYRAQCTIKKKPAKLKQEVELEAGISASDNSVRDHTQVAIIDGDKITVKSKLGKTTVGEFSFPMSEWNKANEFANPNYSRLELMRKLNKNIDESGLNPDRIYDSQVSAILKALSKVGITTPTTSQSMRYWTPYCRNCEKQANLRPGSYNPYCLNCEKRLNMINKGCQIIKTHDDGDQTVKCSGINYVVTTDGKTFKETQAKLLQQSAELEAKPIPREQLPFDFTAKPQPVAVEPARTEPVKPAPVPEDIVDYLASRYGIDKEKAAEIIKQAESAKATKPAVAVPVPETTPVVPPPFPAGIKYKLFPYQQEGYAWLKGRSYALLADDMGLGKTPQAIAWGSDFRPNLVVVPAALTFNWVREISEMWRPGDTVILLDGKTDFPRKLPDWTVMSYGMVPHYLKKIKRAGYKALIIDEAHQVKNMETARTKNILELVAPIEPDQKDKIIPNRLAVTGTPVLNRPIELFALLVFLGVKRRSDAKEFLTTYTEHKVYKGRMIFTGAKNLPELHRSLQPFMLRRLKKDVLKQLPPKTNTPMFVAITNAAEYKEAERNFLEWLREKSGDEAAMNASKAEIITRMNALRQLAAIGKVGPVCDWLKPCTDGQGKTILFSSFLTPLEQIKHCKPESVVYTGADSSQERQIMVDQFQKESNVCYFLGTVGAAGVGITLTAANRVAFLDLPWTPGGKMQAEDRAHRIGQTRPVEIVNILARGTIDERMLELLNEKEIIIAQAIDGKTQDEAASSSVANSLVQSFISAPELNQAVMQYEPEEFDPTPYAVSFDDMKEIAEGFRQDKTGPEIAKKLGVRYDGIQEGAGEPDIMQFTDPITGSTTYGNTPAEVKAALQKMRQAFKDNPPTLQSEGEKVRVTGKCDSRDAGSCQFTISKKGTKIIKKTVKSVSSVKCHATGINELNKQKSALIETGKCYIKKKADMKQDPTASVTGTCSIHGCNLTVKGKIETPGQETGAGGLSKAVDSVIEHLEKRGGTGELISDKTFAPGISTNNRYEFQFAIKEADDLIVSHDPFTFVLNPKYTAKLQPRQRERLANQVQVKKIAAGLDPEKLLLDTKAIDTGSPIINTGNLVLCGNGRVMALILAAAEHPGNIAKYKLALRDIMPKYSLHNDIAKMKLPVLVRVLMTKTNEQAFAEECNARPTIEASAIEKARTDADKVTTGMLNSLDILEGEPIEDALRSGRNKQFVTSFLSKLPENEQALLITANGSLNTDGVRRMGMAIFVATFKGDVGLRLAAQFFEALDTNVKNAFNGILRALGGLAQAENLIANGQRDKSLSFGEDLAKAISVFSVIKKTDGMTVSKYLNQQSFDRELNPFQERVLQVLDEYSRSARRIGDILSNYAQAVIDSPPPGQSSMMGDVRATKEELFDSAVRKVAAAVEAEKAEAAARKAQKEPVAAMGCGACALLLSPTPEKLRALADSMQKTIDEKRDPGVSHQNVTARRARQAAGMSDDADRLEEVQKALRGMADAMTAGTLPDILSKVSSRAQVEQILHHRKYNPPEVHKSNISNLLEIVEGDSTLLKERKHIENIQRRAVAMGEEAWSVVLSPEEIEAVRKVVEVSKTKKNKYGYTHSLTYIMDGINEGTRLQAAGIDSDEKFQLAKTALKSYVSGPSADVINKKAKRELEYKLIGAKIPGFFPTPRKIIDRMLEEADIQPGMIILEPSAGKGDIAEVIKEQCPSCKLTLVENNWTLIQILRAKGFEVMPEDFMRYGEGFKTLGIFDRIIMNPPFEHEQDIDHVKHAFELLNPGGRIVAIMGTHAFFANDKKAVDFREWLDELGGVSEELPAGSFTGEGAFVTTGVNTRIVTIDKPEVFKPTSPFVTKDVIPGGIPICHYGDWCVAPDGKEGKMVGSGGIGSSRCKLVDANDNFIGYYNTDELRKKERELVGALPIPQDPFVPGQQIRLFDNQWLAKKLTGCNLTESDQLKIFSWSPLRNFIAWAAGRKEPVNVCAGMIPGVFQITITGIGRDEREQQVEKRAKLVPNLKRVYSMDDNAVYSVAVPEESEKELSWKPQEINRSVRREPAEQAAMFQKVNSLLTKIRNAKDSRKKTEIWYSANLSREEAEQLVREMILSLPVGHYKLHDRQYGTNIVDSIYNEYGWMPLMLVSEPMMLGLQALHPERIYASFTLGLDAIEIKPKIKAEMHLDPLLASIGRTIGVGCMASQDKPVKSKKPVCDGIQKTKRESCIIDIKAKLPSGCTSKNWNKKPGEKPENCVNPFAVCTAAVGCRIGKKAK